MSSIISAAAFVVREAARRKLGMRHFDVQIIGGAVLPYGSIAEIKTREGKTLVSTLAAYFNAPSGESIHVHHCNDKELDRSCARHTETRSHFIRELVTKGSMTLIYCSINEQLAISFIKLILLEKFVYFRESLGVVEFLH